MLTAILAFALSAAPLPPAFGFVAVQCVPVREVVCIVDVDYSVGTCLHDVPAALAIVNQAAGRQVFRFAGVITPAGIEHARDAGWLMIAGWPTEPAPGALAVTSLGIAEKGWPCIERVAIALAPITARKARVGRYNPVHIIVHELVHALGGEHADPDSRFMSRMEPVYNPDMTPALAPVDIAALRAAYR